MYDGEMIKIVFGWLSNVDNDEAKKKRKTTNSFIVKLIHVIRGKTIVGSLAPRLNSLYNPANAIKGNALEKYLIQWVVMMQRKS